MWQPSRHNLFVWIWRRKFWMATCQYSGLTTAIPSLLRLRALFYATAFMANIPIYITTANHHQQVYIISPQASAGDIPIPLLLWWNVTNYQLPFDILVFTADTLVLKCSFDDSEWLHATRWILTDDYYLPYDGLAFTTNILALQRRFDDSEWLHATCWIMMDAYQLPYDGLAFTANILVLKCRYDDSEWLHDTQYAGPRGTWLLLFPPYDFAMDGCRPPNATALIAQEIVTLHVNKDLWWLVPYHLHRFRYNRWITLFQASVPINS